MVYGDFHFFQFWSLDPCFGQNLDHCKTKIIKDAMTDCVNEVKSRKEEVVEEQETILLKLDEIVDWVLPKMNAATNSKQLIEINKEVLIQFDDVKQQMKLTVSNYTKWSYEKESSLYETRGSRPIRPDTPIHPSGSDMKYR